MSARHVVACTLLFLPAVSVGPLPVEAQFRNGFPPSDLATYEWTAWLVGEWEGEWESAGRVLPYRQTFEYSPDHRYVITHNERGEDGSVYRGFGVFSYYPTTGEAYGEWFGTDHDTNDGWAARDGERMVWTIRRLGMRITRTRTRTGPDTYTVDSEVLTPDGKTTRSRETMRRVASGPAGARDVALEMPRSIDFADYERFIDLFAEDAVMFFPFTASRAVGRASITDVMKPIFDANRARLPGPIFGFEPVDVEVSPLGRDGAVVSWIMNRDAAIQRRSAVLRRDDGRWRIVMVHADNWQR